MALPGAQEIERLAVVLAAAEGKFFSALDGPEAFRYRLLANASIVHMRDRAKLPAEQIVRATLELGVDGLRKAAKTLDDILENAPGPLGTKLRSTHEGLVQTLFQRGAALDGIGKVLEAEARDAPPPVQAPALATEDEPI